jgi:calcineurin-like phosphoesterase
MPIKFVVAQKNVYLQGVLLELETGSGRCLKIERLSLPV